MAEERLTFAGLITLSASGSLVVIANPVVPRWIKVYGVFIATNTVGQTQIVGATVAGTALSILGDVPGGNTTFMTQMKANEGVELPAGQGVYLEGPNNALCNLSFDFSLGAN